MWMVRVLILVVSCLQFSLQAATYYIDFDAGSDANNGTSTGTAFKHCPGDSDATGTAASTTLVAGDTAKFKGGVVYFGGIDTVYKGALGNRTKYDGNSAGDWGTGKAIIDRNYSQSSCIEIAADISHVEINGFELRNAGGFSDDATNVLSAAAGTYTNSVGRAATGVGMWSGRNTNIYVANLYVHRIGSWRNTIGWSALSTTGIGMSCYGGESVTFTNCEITKCGQTGIALSAAPSLTNILVTDCYLHRYITWGIDINVSVYGGRLDGVTITKTRLIDLQQMGGEWSGTPDEAPWYAPHQNYIFIRNDDATTTVWTNVTVSRCWIGETNTTPAGSGGTGAIFISKGPSVNIWNNVFARSWSITGVIPILYYVAPERQFVRIYNNTFYRQCQGSVVTTDGETTGPGQYLPSPDRIIYIANNLIVANAGIQFLNNVDVSFGDYNWPTQLDYNQYFSEYYDAATRRIIPYMSLATWQGFGGEPHGFWGDPLFVSTNAAALDLRLASNSPSIAMGQNLSTYFTTDYAGNTRPAGAWAVGAYEYVNPSVVARTTRGGFVTSGGKVSR